MKRFTPFLFLVLLVSFGCSSQENLAKYKDSEISFGNGGGFTGQEISYTISSDGKVEMTDKLKKEIRELTTLKPRKTLDLFDQLSDLNIENMDFNQPGNQYFFIEQTTGTNTNKVVWGDETKNPPQSVLDYYQLLNSIVNK